ncbi:GNAT family N-acetyltransferase [Phyllobacterium ifriqiyense]|uniref:GNAT family N-acetyltransferase n=1 Tax=Phyllobacterium ifriqiyense TaxID=314238 RepID=UPI00339A4291
MLPGFETDRLLLRPRTMDHFEDCIAMDRDPAVTKFIPGPWTDDTSHRQFLTDRITTDFGIGLGYWSIFEKTRSDQFLGWVLLIPHDAIGPDVEIGWRLNRLAWGKGIATEAAKPVLEHGFKATTVDRIIAAIDPRNSASVRVAEKLGMELMGETEEDGYHFVTYAILRATFQTAIDQLPS